VEWVGVLVKLLDHVVTLIEDDRLAEQRLFSDLPVVLLEVRCHNLHVLYWTYQSAFRCALFS
jgi:hypothetical protein